MNYLIGLIERKILAILIFQNTLPIPVYDPGKMVTRTSLEMNISATE